MESVLIGNSGNMQIFPIPDCDWLMKNGGSGTNIFALNTSTGSPVATSRIP